VAWSVKHLPSAQVIIPGFFFITEIAKVSSAKEEKTSNRKENREENRSIGTRGGWYLLLFTSSAEHWRLI